MRGIKHLIFHIKILLPLIHMALGAIKKLMSKITNLCLYQLHGIALKLSDS